MHPRLQCLLAVLTGGLSVISPLGGVAHDLPAPRAPAGFPAPVANVVSDTVVNLRDLAGPVVVVVNIVPDLSLTVGTVPASPAARLWDTWQVGRAVSYNLLISDAASRTGLPYDFLYRLLRQESGLRADAVSPKGALGIAQFMPATALERGLTDPFDPSQAVIKAAELLRDHTVRFGNLGLAAAAYNAGPGRVERWLAGASGMPQETRDYVQIITGRVVEDWAPAGRWASLRRETGAGAAVPMPAASPLFAAAPAASPAELSIGRGRASLKASSSKTGAEVRRREVVARSEDELCMAVGGSEQRCLVRRTY
ncbi:hypothetical protein ABIE45_000615 [Methylobacterium sp. OAE515]|uniref:lytic transglycosylase domain-containing protein n=1 Tax=Methylobacterium sp. OAE515 TaxID=2817895 RepID=UPI00178B23B2